MPCRAFPAPSVEGDHTLQALTSQRAVTVGDPVTAGRRPKVAPVTVGPFSVGVASIASRITVSSGPGWYAARITGSAGGSMGWLVVVSFCVAILSACQSVPASSAAAWAPTATSGGEQPVEPIPDCSDRFDPKRVALGHRLFDDASLSGDGKYACVTCHPLERG